MDIIEKYKGGVELECGNYFHRLEHPEVSISKESIDKYTEYLSEVQWIRNDRMRLWIATKLIKGEEFTDILNKVFDKGHLFDPDYQALVT